jgi:hypothetical protein
VVNSDLKKKRKKQEKQNYIYERKKNRWASAGDENLASHTLKKKVSKPQSKYHQSKHHPYPKSKPLTTPNLSSPPTVYLSNLKAILSCCDQGFASVTLSGGLQDIIPLA